MYHQARVAMFFFGGFIAVIFYAAADDQYRPRELKSMLFHTHDRLPGKEFSYAMGDLETSYDKGICRFQVSFSGMKSRCLFGTHRKMETGDVVGMLGGVFRAECGSTQAVLERIADKDLPKGVTVPEWDSITVLLQGTTGFNMVILKLLDVAAKGHVNPTASLHITERLEQKGKGQGLKGLRKPSTYLATVKSGDILLLNGRGYEIRAIIPPNKETRVVGWVEFSPDSFLEADLIHDKKAFVRPQLEKKAAK